MCTLANHRGEPDAIKIDTARALEMLRDVALTRLQDSRGRTVGYLKSLRDGSAQRQTAGVRLRQHRQHDQLQALSDATRPEPGTRRTAGAGR